MNRHAEIKINRNSSDGLVELILKPNILNGPCLDCKFQYLILLNASFLSQDMLQLVEL